MSNRIFLAFLEESSSSIIQKITFTKIIKIMPQQASKPMKEGMKGNKKMGSSSSRQRRNHKRSDWKKGDCFKLRLFTALLFTSFPVNPCFESSTDSQILSLQSGLSFFSIGFSFTRIQILFSTTLCAPILKFQELIRLVESYRSTMVSNKILWTSKVGKWKAYVHRDFS